MKEQRSDINLNFNSFFKHIVKLSPNDTQIDAMLENINLLKNGKIDFIAKDLEKIFLKKSKNSNSHNAKIEQIRDITSRFRGIDDIELFIFSIELYQMKDLLLQEAKITKSSELENLINLDPLSLAYDKISILKPYTTRVSSALLALLFFDKLDKKETNFMSESSYEFIAKLSKSAIKFKSIGLEPNQIFMLMFSEVVNQSIISDSGSNYESRILSVLNKNGISNINKNHDKNDKSTEFDFFFEIDGKTYGIGAKRTLRERYKQFIKTAITSKIDVMIEELLPNFNPIQP